MTHKLKILPEYYQAVKSGDKDFEIRFNDRDFKVGDMVVLREYEENYTDSEPIERRIKYIYAGEIGLKEGFCVLGMEDPSVIRKTKIIECPKCGLKVSTDFNNCPRCGIKICV